MPAIELVRLVSSGTEATMSAIRLARGYYRTRQDPQVRRLLSRSDALLGQAAGSGALTLGVPSSPGVPAGFIGRDHGVLQCARRGTRRFPRSPASRSPIIVEPVAGNMNCVPPAAGFLAGLRDLCTRYGAVLIFDEVHDWVSRRARGAPERATASRPTSRRAGQDRRRRHAGRRLEDAARDHGAGSPRSGRRSRRGRCRPLATAAGTRRSGS
jgi:glutamate-1-semialdehyde 2,1-aminomutase